MPLHCCVGAAAASVRPLVKVPRPGGLFLSVYSLIRTFCLAGCEQWRVRGLAMRLMENEAEAKYDVLRQDPLDGWTDRVRNAEFRALGRKIEDS